MEIMCPNCETVVEVTASNKKDVVCPKCLASSGKRFIMIEHLNDSVKNMGDGFFTKEG